MKIELKSDLMYCVAEHCAEIVHGHMVQMHLRRSWGIWEDGALPNIYENRPFQRDQLNEIRAAVRSIKNHWDRRQFCLTLKFLLNKICSDKHTHRKWQDYIASVKQAKAEHDANQPKLPPPILERGISTHKPLELA